MSSWLRSVGGNVGGSLYSFTGQITNLTKDLLSETTGETIDIDTDLKLSKAKILELEQLLELHKLEVEKLKNENIDLQARYDGVEIQIQEMNIKTRQLLMEQEKEICKLRQQLSLQDSCNQQHDNITDQTDITVGGTFTPRFEPDGEFDENDQRSSAVSFIRNDDQIDDDVDFVSASSRSGLNYAMTDEREDLDGNASDSFHDDGLVEEGNFARSFQTNWQHKLNNLGPQTFGNKRLVKNFSGPRSSASKNASDVYLEEKLRQEIKGLEQRLRDLDESRCQELTALQDLHFQNVSQLKCNHQREVEQLKAELKQLQVSVSTSVKEVIVDKKEAIFVANTDLSKPTSCSVECQTVYDEVKELQKLNFMQQFYDVESHAASDSFIATDVSHSNDLIDDSNNAKQLSVFPPGVTSYLKQTATNSVGNNQDTQSQLSDLSAVSVNSRQLDEHVKSIFSQIERYETQIDSLQHKRLMGNKSNEVKLAEETDSNDYHTDAWHEMDDILQESVVQDQEIAVEIENLKGKLQAKRAAVVKVFEKRKDRQGKLKQQKSLPMVTMETELMSDESKYLEIVEEKQQYWKNIISSVYNIVSQRESNTSFENFISMPDLEVVLMSKLRSFLEELFALRNKDNANQEELRNLQERCSELTLMVQTLTDERDQCRFDMNIISETLEAMKVELSAAKSSDLEELQTAKSCVAKLQNEMAYLHQECLKTLNLTNDEDSNSSNSLVELFTGCLQKLVELENDKFDLEKCLEDLNADLVNVCDEWKQNEQLLSNKNNELSCMVEDLRKKKEHSIAVLEFENLKGNVNSNQSEDLLRQIAELKEIILLKESECQETHQEMNSMNAKFDAILSENEQLSTALQKHDFNWQALVNDLQQQINYVINENQTLSQHLSYQQGQLEIALQQCVKPKSEQDSGPMLENVEMTKEAIKSLSEMVRDKDIDIQALKDKIASLLQFFKQTSDPDTSNGTVFTLDHNALESLLLEKETLTKQLADFKLDREHLLAALNQKHQESTSYHAEIQRLVALLKDERPKYAKLAKDCEILKEQKAQLESDLQVSQTALQDLQRAFNENVVKLESHMFMESTVANNDDLHKQVNDELAQTNEACHALKENVMQLEQACANKSSELTNMRQQVERLSFQLNEAQIKLADYEQSEASLRSNINNYVAEIEGLKATNYELMLSVQKQSEQLLKLSSDSNNIAEEKRLDNDGDKEKVEILLKERDQLVLVLRNKQNEMERQSHECDIWRDNCKKLQNELTRLREHLMQIEEAFTGEAVLAEERESELRQKLRHTENLLEKEESHRQQGGLQIDKLLAQIQHLEAEKSAALGKLAAAQGRLHEEQASLMNLQRVLDQFQSEKDNIVASEIQRYEKQYLKCATELSQAKQQIGGLEATLAEQAELIAAGNRLSDKIDDKESELSHLKIDLQSKISQIDALKSELYRLSSSGESKIDKLLIKNLLIGYFHTPSNKRDEALRIIASLLQCTDQEAGKMGLVTSTTAQSGWLGGWLSKKQSSTASASSHEGVSLAEMFIKFVERESNPATSQSQQAVLTFPVDDIVRDVGIQKQQAKLQHLRHVQQLKQHVIATDQSPPGSPTSPIFIGSGVTGTSSSALSSNSEGFITLSTSSLSGGNNHTTAGVKEFSKPSLFFSPSSSKGNTDTRNALLSILQHN